MKALILTPTDGNSRLLKTILQTPVTICEGYFIGYFKLILFSCFVYGGLILKIIDLMITKPPEANIIQRNKPSIENSYFFFLF